MVMYFAEIIRPHHIIIIIYYFLFIYFLHKKNGTSHVCERKPNSVKMTRSK